MLKGTPGSQLVLDNMTRRGYDPLRGSHGTRFVEGQTHVDPGGSVGKNNHVGLSRADRAYYSAPSANPTAEDNTMYESGGWYWADQNETWDKHAVTGHAVRGRPVIHEVKPIGNIDGDPVLNKDGQVGTELTADRLEITDTQWIKRPRSEYTVVQGTLPGYNWNRQAPLREDGTPYGIGGYNNDPQDTYYNRNLRISKEERLDKREETPQIPGQLEF